jgi:hypothetical protein
MSREKMYLLVVVAIVILLAGGSQYAPAQTPTAIEATALQQLDTILTLDALSATLWPDWEISSSTFALLSGSSACYVLNHPAPPSGLTRVRTGPAVGAPIYHASTEAKPVSPASGYVGETRTAFVHASPQPEGLLPAAFRTAFAAHQTVHCPEMNEPLDFGAGFAVSPRNLALVDIECELLAAAMAAPADSLDAIVRDFVSVRGFRRVGMTGRFVDYERHREHIDGTAAYIGIMCRDAAPRFLNDRTRPLLAGALGVPGCEQDLFKSACDMDWYKGKQLLCTGAAICLLLDRIEPDWKTDVSERCIDPYAVLWSHFSGGSADVTRILERHGFARREEAAAAFIDRTKSEPEKLFERITLCGESLFIINTEQLVSTTVSYDRRNIAEVDRHRTVHKRVLKIEYSGGSHVYVSGRPVAVVLGQDEFDFRQLIFEAPDEYEITVRGEPFTPLYGINHLNGALSVKALGLDIEVQDAVIVVGDNRISFLLHR